MISELQKNKLMHLFNVLDINKNGKLQLDDFVHVSRKIVNQLNLEEDSRLARLILIKANRIFVQFLIDTNQPGFEIDIWDWMQFFEKALDESSHSNKVKHFIHRTNYHLFSLFDLNNDRFISMDEYANMFSIYNLDDSDCEKSFKALDKNSDEYISVDEMIAGLDDFFYSKRVEASGNLIFGDWKKVSLV